MKRRKRKNFIQVFLSKLLVMFMGALILLQLTVLGLRLRTEYQLRNIHAIYDMGYAQFDKVAGSGTVEDWKETMNCMLSLMEAQVNEIMPGAKASGYLVDSNGDKIAEPNDELYAQFYKLVDGELVSVGTYVCDREYLESKPELKEYLNSVEKFKSKSVWEDWTSKEFQCCKLSVMDGYADPVTHEFYLGNCTLTTFHTEYVGRYIEFYDDLFPYESDAKEIEYIDLTPKDTTGLLKYTAGPTLETTQLGDESSLACVIWMYDGTDTYEETTDNILNRSGQFAYEFRDINGRSYRVILDVNTNMAEAYREVIILCAIIYLAIAFLISLFSAKLTYNKLNYFYKNEDYRKALMNAMTHDLRTPLTVMSGYAENLCENVQTDKREHYARSILENVDYMNGIISDISNLTKLEETGMPVKSEKVDLCRILTELKDEHVTQMKEKELSITIDGSFVSKIEEASMKRALDNLLVNAIRYSPKGGTIRVVGRTVPILKREIYIENQIEDTIKVKTKKLWEPFVKGDESRSNRNGIGLGLAIAKGILESQGLRAKIKIKGDRFIVTIQKR